MAELDLNALAAHLAATAADLAGHIERRAREIAEPLIADADAAYRARTAELCRGHEADRRRKDDLVAELRRQLDAQVRSNERLRREVAETRGAVHRVEMLKARNNEDGKDFVFTADLYAALAEPRAEAPPMRSADA